jgi:hypothetical protein
MIVIPLAALNVRIRSSERSTIGERCHVHRQMKVAPIMTATTNAPTIRGLPQPHS